MPTQPSQSTAHAHGLPTGCVSPCVHRETCSEAATSWGLQGHPDKAIQRGGCAHGNSLDSLQLPGDGCARSPSPHTQDAFVGMEKLKPERLCKSENWEKKVFVQENET